MLFISNLFALCVMLTEVAVANRSRTMFAKVDPSRRSEGRVGGQTVGINTGSSILCVTIRLVSDTVSLMSTTETDLSQFTIYNPRQQLGKCREAMFLV